MPTYSMKMNGRLIRMHVRSPLLGWRVKKTCPPLGAQTAHSKRGQRSCSDQHEQQRQRVCVLTFAGLPVGDGLGGVSVVALPAVVAVAAGGEVAAFEAHAARLAARQFVQLHVEAAAAGVIVAVAR